MSPPPLPFTIDNADAIIELMSDMLPGTINVLPCLAILQNPPTYCSATLQIHRVYAVRRLNRHADLFDGLRVRFCEGETGRRLGLRLIDRCLPLAFGLLDRRLARPTLD